MSKPANTTQPKATPSHTIKLNHNDIIYKLFQSLNVSFQHMPIVGKTLTIVIQTQLDQIYRFVPWGWYTLDGNMRQNG